MQNAGLILSRTLFATVDPPARISSPPTAAYPSLKCKVQIMAKTPPLPSADVADLALELIALKPPVLLASLLSGCATAYEP